MILEDSFLLFKFCSASTYGNVNYDYMPETFGTSEEQRNNFTFDEEKEMCLRKKQEVIGSNKVVLPHTFSVLKSLAHSDNNWTSSSVQFKYISGNSFNFTFFFGVIFYQMCLRNVFLCVFIKFSTRINNNFSTHRQDN